VEDSLLIWCWYKVRMVGLGFFEGFQFLNHGYFGGIVGGV
jgi:hypothetical protein